jgi:hypothetical protein
MPEMWAHCEPCSRWFFVEFSSGEEMSRARCPVCATPAGGFEVRLDEASFPVEMQDGQAVV